MTGLICLQGGREFTPACREIDRGVLDRTDDGPVAVLAGAARVGDDYDGASDRARRYYEGLDADVVIVPDPRHDVDAAVATLHDDLALIVLPGGSPGSLLDVLRGAVRERVIELHEAGTAISGASAGAMVLCTRMVRPGGPGGGDVVDGLGLVDGLALPHWSPGSSRDWPVPDDVSLWGLPECGGVIVEGDGSTFAAGAGEPSRRVDGQWSPVPRAT